MIIRVSQVKDPINGVLAFESAEIKFPGEAMYDTVAVVTFEPRNVVAMWKR